MEATEVLKLVNCALNVPLALTTTLGNALILAAIWKTPSLHSATNALVFGLALSDLGVGLISQPLAIFKLSKLFGKSKELTLIFQMFSVSFASVSLLTVTAIGVDRYLALRLHLRYQELPVTISRGVCVLVLMWVGCISFAASSCVWHRYVFRVYCAASPVIVACLLINMSVYRKLYRVCRFHHARIGDQAMAVFTLEDEQIVWTDKSSDGLFD